MTRQEVQLDGCLRTILYVIIIVFLIGVLFRIMGWAW